MSGAQAVFSCAREALFYGLKLLDRLPQRIHIPAYCCRSVLAPIERLKLEVRFYDVDKQLKPVINNRGFGKGDILLLIHYFGIPQDTQYINQICKEFGMLLVEDCAHTLPNPGVKQTMGSLGAFSIYSLRKQLPVPDGGVLIVNDAQIKGRMLNIPLPELRKTPLKRWLVINFDRMAFSLGWPNTLVIKDALRGQIGSGDNVFHAQLSNDAVPEVSRITLQVLSHIDINAVVKIRLENYRYLANCLANVNGVIMPFPLLPDGAVPQAFPFLLKENIDNVCISLQKNGIAVGRWPGREFPREVPLSDFPGTFLWTESLLLLPLHQDLTTAHIDRIVHVLKKGI